MWLIGALVRLLAAPGSNCPLARVMDGHIMRCGTIGLCQSAATSSAAGHESDSCKWRYIASVQTFTFTAVYLPHVRTIAAV